MTPADALVEHSELLEHRARDGIPFEHLRVDPRQLEIAKPEVDQRTRCLGGEAAAPVFGTEPVAELCSAVTREAAETDRAEQGIGSVAARDRERDPTAL